MAANKISIKHVQIDKANKLVIIATSIAAVVVILSGFIGYGMFKRLMHQEKVISKRETALNNLESNIDARDKIITSYNNFLTTGPQPGQNILGGLLDNQTDGALDGENAKIILDALPSKYDYPALAATVEKLLASEYNIDAIEGTDDEIAQAAVLPSPNPAPVEIPIAVKVENTNYDGAVKLVSLFQSSIRPFKVNGIVISGDNNKLSVDLNMTTYYLPEKILGITEEFVR